MDTELCTSSQESTAHIARPPLTALAHNVSDSRHEATPLFHQVVHASSHIAGAILQEVLMLKQKRDHNLISKLYTYYIMHYTPGTVAN